MTDSKKLKEAEWCAKHTLTSEQVKQLMADKLARAIAHHKVVSARETLLKGRQNRKRVIGNATLPARKTSATNVGGLEDDKFLAITGMCKNLVSKAYCYQYVLLSALETVR